MTDDVVSAGPIAQVALMRGGDLSSRELTEATIQALLRENPALNAVVEVLAGDAVARADEADRRRAGGEDGPLLGVPIVVKNEHDIAGHVTAQGSRAVTQLARSDGEIVQRLRAAGMPIVATSALPELATSGFTESDAYGVTRNPRDLDRTPGGSSGGSAALVAAGAVGIATASDGAGSIRIPAACCGLPGFKPTQGTMPGSGGWHNMSTQGCLTRQLKDAALYLETFGDFKGSLVDASSHAPRRLRIGVTFAGAVPVKMAPIEAGVRDALQRSADLLSDLGHDVRPVDLKYGAAPKALTVRYLAGIAQSAAEVDTPALLQRNTRGMATLGRAFPVPAIAMAQRLGREWGDTVHEKLGVDVLLTPVMTGVAPQVGRFAGKSGLATVLAMNAFYPYTAQWNHAGLPAVSLPAGADDNGRPFAVQLIAQRGTDADLMSLAGQVEGRLG
ncbi:MAG: amidase [Aeromicrobium sp.]